MMPPHFEGTTQSLIKNSDSFSPACFLKKKKLSFHQSLEVSFKYSMQNNITYIPKNPKEVKKIGAIVLDSVYSKNGSGWKRIKPPP